VKIRHVQGCSLRLCRLRINGLTLRASIECTDRILVYGPSNPSSFSLTEARLKHTASLVGLGEKLGTNPWIGQPACC
jgi:hypothetical protein